MDKALALGRVLKMFRERSGLTQGDLSRALEARARHLEEAGSDLGKSFATSIPSLRRTERGDRAVSVLEIHEICDILGISLPQLLREWEALAREPSPGPMEASPGRDRSPSGAPQGADYARRFAGATARRPTADRLRQLLDELRGTDGELPALHIHLPDRFFDDGD